MGKTVTIPADAQRRIAILGQNLRVARKRRGLSVAGLAQKAGFHRDTVSAIERGQPGATIGGVVTMLWALGLDKSLAAVADPEADLHGKTLEAARLPKRVRKKAARKDEYEF